MRKIAPPQQSAAEIKQQEVMAKVTTNFALGLCAVLYICGYTLIPRLVEDGRLDCGGGLMGGGMECWTNGWSND